MSSETTELTFVRCPSCRSLVPATATRCRICNNPLEGGGKSDESEASKAASRIRQKTISASADEVASALAEVHVDSAPEPIAPTSSSPTAVQASRPPVPPADDDVDFDPLGAYLQELEEAEELGSPNISAPQQAPLGATQSVAAQDNDDFDPFDLDIFDEPSDEPTPAPAVAAPVTESVHELPPEPIRTTVAAASQPPVQFEAPQESMRSQEPVQPARPKEQQEPRRPFGMPAQQGRGPGGAPEGARPERRAEQRPNEQRANEQRPRDERGQEQRRPKDSPQQRPNNQQNQQQPRRDARGEQRHDAPKAHKNGHESRSEQRSEQRPEPQGGARQPDRALGGSARPAKINPGRLFGWLVSYENPDGRAIEVREGKFFVTGNSIKTTDLVIEDPSISTPHALMSVSSESGFKVQDLMSDRGLFVRSREGGQYRREEGTIELKHGDWIRFGDVEFLIVIVPTGSGK
jgi:hypothetical protein